MAPMPRVLLVTVNALSATSNNGKTFASFFEGYQSDRLAQLFFHREVPTSDVCDNYYRIGDEEYVRYVARRSPFLGERATRGEVEDALFPRRAINAAKKSELVRLARAAVWTGLNLRSPGVSQWLEDFHPEVIFFCGGDANYLYRPVFDLVDRFDAKLVYYITDDYVLESPSASPVEKIKRAWTRRLFKEAVRRSSLILTIGDEMSRVYAEEFGMQSSPVMNLVDLPELLEARPEVSDGPPRLAYVGGLHLDRWKSLVRIANGLARYEDNGLRPVLDVYAQHVPEDAADLFKAHPCIQYQGSLSADEVPTVLRDGADLLVHVESHDTNARRGTRLSVSTKIPEYLASGTPVLAVGPEEVASMRYLANSGAAFVVTNQDDADLDGVIRAALQDEGARKKVVHAGLDLVRLNHDGALRRRWFHSELGKLMKEI